MATHIENADEGFVLQIVKFSSRIGSYVVTLGLDPAKVAAVQADSELFNYVFVQMKIYRDFAEGFTTYKNLLRYGHNNDVLGPIPVPPALPTPIPAVTSAKAEARFAALIQDCVRSSNFSQAIADDLGIGASNLPFDPATGKPLLIQGLSSAGHPHIKWKKGKFQGIVFYIDRGDGWVFLDRDFHPDFTDKLSPLPAAGVSEVWKYKAIYLFDDEEVGEYSEEISITVTGPL